MKYKRDIYMELRVPWPMQSESVVHFLPIFVDFYEDHNKKSPLTKFELFTKCMFQEIGN